MRSRNRAAASTLTFGGFELGLAAVLQSLSHPVCLMIQFNGPRERVGGKPEMNDPHHSILERPWLWEIEYLEWIAGSEDTSAILNVTFIRNGARRTLCFVDPTDVRLNIGGRPPIQCGEMVILDIRGRQLSGLGVQVTEGGASGSPLHLYARMVKDLGVP
jgi:hypothetical protein